MTRILIIDPQFAKIPDIEREVAGPNVTFDILRPNGGGISIEAVSSADAILNCRSRHGLPASLVAQMGRTRIVVQAGVGFNHIDIEACAKRGIPVCNTPDYGTREVADHTVALALSLLRGVTAYNDRLRARDDSWSTQSLPLPPIRRIAGQVLGVVGLGRIGTAVANRAKAFEMQVIFHDPFVAPGQELALNLQRATTLQELLAQADILTLHCPLTARTENLIDDAAVAAMKPGAILINTARGRIVDLDAVEAGLRSGRLCAAGLDVLPTEPVDRGHSLIAAWLAREAWLEGRLILSPHAAFYTPESLADMRRLSMRAIVEFLLYGRLRSCVNLRQLERHGHRFDA